MSYGMVIDLDKCVGCQACMVSCKMHNSQPPGVWWNRVFTQGAQTHLDTVVSSKGDFTMDFLPVSCQMCEKPACESVCPTGATYTNDDGVVLVDYKRCIGCRYCMVACPYNVRHFNWKNPKKAKKDYGGYEYGYPFDVKDGKHLVYTRHRPTGVVEKCTFCFQYMETKEQPACVRACTGKARFFGVLNGSEMKGFMNGKKPMQLLPEKGTEPKVFYISEKKDINLRGRSDEKE